MGSASKNSAVIYFLGFFALTLVCQGSADEGGGSRFGALQGRVVDAASGEAVDRALVLVEALERSTMADAQGHFFFNSLPAGAYALRVLRVGYRQGHWQCVVAVGDTVALAIKLHSAPISTATFAIEGQRAAQLSQLQEPEVVVSDKKLRQNLGATVAATMAHEPGVSRRSMGSAPSRPVLRGLGGARLLVLEDGGRTGDLSATASDHAVAIEPMTAERIEVIRGPEALLFGSNTLAGVVNVVRGYIPATLPQRFGGAASVQGESVSSGYATGTHFVLPAGPLALRLDGSYRRAGDLSTPLGGLSNTAIATGNISLGLSLVRSWGHAGVAAGFYDSDYGIPPDPLGGHAGGVDIELERQHFEAKAEILPHSSWLRRLELRHAFSRYQHAEFEASGDLGIEFGVLTHNVSTTARLKRLGPLANGAAGFWGEYRNFAAAGLSFTPPTEEYAGAFVLYQEMPLDRFSANASLRFDARRVEPRSAKDSPTVGRIRTRSFSGFSGALSGHYRFGARLTTAATVMQTFRAPSVEEIFSEGPHLASYSYEVGNADLGTERGVGLEISVAYEYSEGHLQLVFFRNDIRGYIFPQNTGEFSLRRADLLLYRFAGERALMRGVEGGFAHQFTPRWSTAAALSYVRGDLVERAEPIPRLPPLQGRFNVEYKHSANLSLNATLRLARDQDRPGAFEAPTEGYAVWDLGVQYLFAAGGYLHTLTLAVDNAADVIYRRHLNQVREIVPEPGRNVRLLHKVFF